MKLPRVVATGGGTCKWCLRGFGESSCVRRRERGLECKACLQVLTENYPQDCLDRRAFLAKCTANPDIHVEIKGMAEALEEAWKKGERKRGCQTGAPVSVQAKSTEGVKEETPRGVFWPAIIFEEEFKQKIPRKSQHWRTLGPRDDSILDPGICSASPLLFRLAQADPGDSEILGP